MNGNDPDPPELQELENTAAWRLRLVDADSADVASAAAARVLESLVSDLHRDPYAVLWAELRALVNWLGESDAISDYAELTAQYRMRIGVFEQPTTGADYLRHLLAIARGLI